MKEENISLIRELCYIANERNMINHRRTKARWRKSYWQKAIKTVEAFKGSSSELKRLKKRVQYVGKDISPDEKRIVAIESEMHHIRYHRKSLPKKWIAMGSMKLRALALKSEAEYAQAKYDTMMLSEKTTKRVKCILKAIDSTLRYDNGYVVAIISNSELESNTGGYLDYPKVHASNKEEIAKLAEEYELSKAVDDMLKESK